MSQSRESDKQRILNTLRREPVDRVPNYEVVIEARTTRHLLGRDDAAHSMALEPEDKVRLAQITGQDVIVVPVVDYTLANREEGGRAYEGNIRTRAELASAGRFSVEGHIQPAVERLKRHIEAVQGTRLGVCACVTSLIFDRTVYALGFENYMRQVLEDPAFVAETMDVYTEYATALVHAICRVGVDMIHVGDDVAFRTGLFIPLDRLRELWVGRVARVIAPALEAGIPVVFHSDGCLTDVIPLLIELGFCAVNPVEPYSNDIYALKQQYGGRITLIGNIDISLLATGSTAEVETDVRRHLDRLSPGGGYVLSSSHSITGAVDPASFVAMLETGWRYECG